MVSATWSIMRYLNIFIRPLLVLFHSIGKKYKIYIFTKKKYINNNKRIKCFGLIDKIPLHFNYIACCENLLL